MDTGIQDRPWKQSPCLAPQSLFNFRQDSAAGKRRAGMPQSWGVPGMEGQEGEVKEGFEKASWDVSPSA